MSGPVAKREAEALVYKVFVASHESTADLS